MIDGLTTAIIVAGLAVAGFSGLMALLNRPPSVAHLAGLAVAEILLLTQAVVAVASMFTGSRPDGMVTFVGYLLTAVLVPPLAALLGAAERTRWGSTIIAVAGLVVAVMVLRLQQVWGG